MIAECTQIAVDETGAHGFESFHIMIFYSMTYAKGSQCQIYRRQNRG